jgi:erythromycin esterase
MRRISLYLLLLLPFLGRAGGVDSVKVQQLKSRMQPLTSTEANATDADLLFLLEALKGKDIIAAGEATHGSKEFFTLKHRLFKLLCEKGDVKTFGLEESYAAGLLVNEYIQGKNNLKASDVVMKMSFMWRTKEMKDLIEWMKAYNDDAKHVQKITFFGFDFHGPHHAVKWLYAYFGAVDTVYLASIKPFLKKFEDKTYPKEKISDKELDENKSSIEAIRAELKSKKEKYLAQGEQKLVEADHLLECLFQYSDAYKSGDVDFFKRDPYMCGNVKWMQNLKAGSKIMLWAHNEHVAAGGSLPSMGKLLKQAYREKFYSIGFVFNEGEYTGTKQYKCSALEAGIFSFNPAPSGTFSDLLSNTGVKAGFLAMNGAGLDEKTTRWFLGPQRVYEVGYRGFDNMKKLLLKKRKLGEIYDGVFFVKKVSNTEHYMFGPNKSGTAYFNPFPTN